jgi:pimeloyl-ACP methyl ester carboxylesterase
MHLRFLALPTAMAVLCATPVSARQVPPAISTDSPRDSANPARMVVLHIPTGGVKVNGVAYLAPGAGPHPTLLLLHGWPGNEKNLDLAQAVRRAGWNAITFNYRGSWGSPGAFRFAHCLEDAQAVLAYLRDAATARSLGIDTARMVMAGHSMGGWVTVHTAARDHGLRGAVLISAADMGAAGARPHDRLVQAASGNSETLAATPEQMAQELSAHGAEWRFDRAYDGLASVPMLVITSNDGLAAWSDSLVGAVRARGNHDVTTLHLATDHSYSDRRIALESAVVRWLGARATRSPVAASPDSIPASWPALPDTPAGFTLRAWLDVFNSGDSARIDVFDRQYQPDLSPADTRRLRERTGGLDLISLLRSEPRQVAFLVRERHGPTVAFGAITVSDTDPLRLDDFVLRAAGPNVTVDSLRIDAADRARVIAGAAAQLDSFYVFPAVAAQIGDSLRARVARGAYDAYEDGFTFARRLNDEVRAISHDKHMRVEYSARPIPVRDPDAEPSPDDVARDKQRLEEINCGFDKAEVLPGNVGYLKFDMFARVDLCGGTASAAMTFLAGTRALIVDLRENGGGQPAMVAWIASYLFDARTHLNDLWTRRTDATAEFWTTDSVPGRKFGGTKPVYVLTSSRTFSGAEEFTYNLQTQHRATVIGETTGGGAHPVSPRRVDAHFTIGVPFARAINPVTHTNWEGTGVEPDVKVAVAEALAKAEALIKTPQ